MDLRHYLRVFRAHWLGMLVLVVAAVAIAFGWTLLQPRVYTADATAIVQATAAADDIGTKLVGNQLAASSVKTFVNLGSSRSVAERVIADLGLETTPERLASQVTVTNPLDTYSLKVTATASSPEAARDIAESWVRGMGAEVNVLETADEEKPGLVYLAAIDSARLPTSPSSPNTRLALAIGGLIGLAIAFGYAMLRYTLDRRIRSVDGVEKELGVAVVGTLPEEKSFTADNRLIPQDGGTSVNSSSAHLFAIAEAMRELRTNIQFMDVDNPPRVIVITSPLPGDGKSTTASNLAITLASSGERVILIDGDLRRPMIGKIFGLVESVGLSEVLSGRAEIAQVAQRIPGRDNLIVVAAGKLPPNPSEVLGSAKMHELLTSLANEAIVIIDAPPLIPVTDAAVLTQHADGAVVVATVGKTTFEVLGKALGNLERANARALGIVLNRVPRRGTGAAYYGYQYHGDYYRADSEPSDSETADAEAGPRRRGATIA
ncbi:polysaccharide biosynthesis tyrosine autokinase [Microbacterium sp. LTA6]|uniref:polysaccharide biosynthesis tyrosine autokinase n=1 Tax=unclassified Microbacterium TaxID=2609290 RepID=UPI0031389068